MGWSEMKIKLSDLGNRRKNDYAFHEANVAGRILDIKCVDWKTTLHASVTHWLELFVADYDDDYYKKKKNTFDQNCS